MGEVYRATRHEAETSGRAEDSAAALSRADAERLARFQREAEVLASLNHPNIAAIHGLEESGGLTALVMELVEGDDLSQRIARGAIPLDEALADRETDCRRARSGARARDHPSRSEAGEYQGACGRHGEGARLRARRRHSDASRLGLTAQGDVANSPTITTPAMTQAGMILGTAAYMSPEQARGKPVDKRTDIWAFGCVLLRNADRRARVWGRRGVRHAGRNSACRSRLERLYRQTSPPALRKMLRALPRQRSQEAVGRYGRCAVRDR